MSSFASGSFLGGLQLGEGLGGSYTSTAVVLVLQLLDHGLDRACSGECRYNANRMPFTIPSGVA